MNNSCKFTLNETTKVYICVCQHLHKCDKCRPTFSIPAGIYYTKLSHYSLDIVQVKDEYSFPKFISDANGKKYDWTVNYPRRGFTIVEETTPIETQRATTVVIGDYAVRGEFRSFSLTDEFNRDEGWYAFVINKYKTKKDMVGVCFSGFQNECDYNESIHSPRMFKKKNKEREKITFVNLSKHVKTWDEPDTDNEDIEDNVLICRCGTCKK